VSRIAAIPEIEELNIGHSIVSRAVLVGLERAVRDMKAAMRGEQGDPGETAPLRKR
jgi:pyridoxine 5-phosphate synthase